MDIYLFKVNNKFTRRVLVDVYLKWDFIADILPTVILIKKETDVTPS